MRDCKMQNVTFLKMIVYMVGSDYGEHSWGIAFFFIIGLL